MKGGAVNEDKSPENDAILNKSHSLSQVESLIFYDWKQFRKDLDIRLEER